ncbi:MAG: ABC transporter permease, partial [Crenarchaeota archaeon]|nr:ABC transporter permease [Thermoproteota archaeon]
MGLRQYLIKKIVVYALTFFVAVSLDWAIPRFMPGSPIYALISRFASMPGAAKYLYSYFMQAFGLNKPLWQQYIDFWIAVLHGDLGISIYMYPEKVLNIIASALPYDIALLVPSITLSWIIGNWLGAIAAKKRRLDNTLMPVLYFLTSSPYFWLAIVLAWIFTVVIPLFPPSGAYSPGMVPSLSLSFIKDFLWHWFLPFLSLFLVMLGGWAIGMRNLIIYELESDYAKYMEALGAPDNLILRYAFKHAIL